MGADRGCSHYDSLLCSLRVKWRETCLNFSGMPLGIISSQLAPHHSEERRCLNNAAVFRPRLSLPLKLEENVFCGGKWAGARATVLVLVPFASDVGTCAPVDNVSWKVCFYCESHYVLSQNYMLELILPMNYAVKNDKESHRLLGCAFQIPPRPLFLKRISLDALNENCLC